MAGGGDEDVLPHEHEVVDVKCAGKDEAPVRDVERAIGPREVRGDDLSGVVSVADTLEEEDLVRCARAADDQLAQPLVVEQAGGVGQVHGGLPGLASVASEQQQEVLVLA